MAVLADTNILVRVLDVDSARQLSCRKALDKARSNRGEVFICAQVMIEFWAVVTRPIKSGGLGMTPADADGSLLDFNGFLPILPEPPDSAGRWRRLAVANRVIGKSVHDTRLAALMESHGIDAILTLNGVDFKRFSHLRVIEPQDY